ncbi:MAG: hypothetical protein ABWY62_03360, partial [Acidimicrobiia bacterium]
MENRSPANVGNGAERWIPKAFSASHRAARFWNPQLARGPTGPPILPIVPGRAMRLLRNRARPPTLPSSTRRARARALISAIFTPVG